MKSIDLPTNPELPEPKSSNNRQNCKNRFYHYRRWSVLLQMFQIGVCPARLNVMKRGLKNRPEYGILPEMRNMSIKKFFRDFRVFRGRKTYTHFTPENNMIENEWRDRSSYIRERLLVLKDSL